MKFVFRKLLNYSPEKLVDLKLFVLAGFSNIFIVTRFIVVQTIDKTKCIGNHQLARQAKTCPNTGVYCKSYRPSYTSAIVFCALSLLDWCLLQVCFDFVCLFTFWESQVESSYPYLARFRQKVALHDLSIYSFLYGAYHTKELI